MSDDPRDTGDIAEVPADQRLESDEGEGTNALRDFDHPGPDDDLDDVYADPGEEIDVAAEPLG